MSSSPPKVLNRMRSASREAIKPRSPRRKAIHLTESELERKKDRSKAVKKVIEGRTFQKKQYYNAIVFICCLLALSVLLLSAIFGVFFRGVLSRIDNFEAQISKKPNYKEVESQLIAHNARIEKLVENATELNKSSRSILNQFESQITNVKMKYQDLSKQVVNIHSKYKADFTEFARLAQEKVNMSKKVISKLSSTLDELAIRLNETLENIETYHEIVKIQPSLKGVLKKVSQLLHSEGAQFFIPNSIIQTGKPIPLPFIGSVDDVQHDAFLEEMNVETINGYPRIEGEGQKPKETRTRPDIFDLREVISLNKTNQGLEYVDGRNQENSFGCDMLIDIEREVRYRHQIVSAIFRIFRRTERRRTFDSKEIKV